jgi:hypothetical protein
LEEAVTFVFVVVLFPGIISALLTNSKSDSVVELLPVVFELLPDVAEEFPAVDPFPVVVDAFPAVDREASELMTALLLPPWLVVDVWSLLMLLLLLLMKF